MREEEHTLTFSSLTGSGVSVTGISILQMMKVVGIPHHDCSLHNYFLK
jgi:hypothetical protein